MAVSPYSGKCTSVVTSGCVSMECVEVYSKQYYLNYTNGDDVFASYLENLDKEKADRNRKRLAWKDESGSYHSEDLPETMWRQVEYLDWKKTKTRSKDDVTAEEYAVIAKRDEEAAIEAAEAAVDAEKEATRLAEEEATRIRNEAEQRDAMRKKCMFSAEKRRWGWGEEDWTSKRQKRETGPVPKLRELAELALQAAFEKRGDDLQLEHGIRDNVSMMTPAEQNSEPCRIFESVPAVEMWSDS